ncbi:peptidoglycan recognition protein family protein [Nesterenkonia populi]|uniref:peptidoglycan recognition protein family protein n=1 Tax=Nesterenkonia populi TaxID=1591087 RepID=UPI0011BD7D75|nr:peptidoglycan recognition family protein [Nesterenkonia populi]
MSAVLLGWLYQRPQWGAKYRPGFGDRSASYPLREAWTHHTVTHLGPNATIAQEAAHMRVLEEIGQQRFGGGISYTFVIFASGRVWVGTGASRIGAHTGGRNSISVSFAFVGNFTTAQASTNAIAAAGRLIRELRQAGVLARPRTNGGHRDAPGQATACPGNALYRQIPRINQIAAQSGSTTAGTSTPTLEGPVMSAEEYAKAVHDYDKGHTPRDEPRSMGWQIMRSVEASEAALAEVKDVWGQRTHNLREREQGPATKGFEVAQANLFAIKSYEEAKAARRGVEALAVALEELAPGIAEKVAEAAREGAREGAAEVNAEDVADKLTIDVKKED